MTAAMVTNSAGNDYTLTGSGTIDGFGTLVKSGAGALTIFTGTNSYSGGTLLNGGVLNANSFGANANVVTVGSGGQAFNNGAVNVANPFVISGNGPDGNGAIRMLQSSSRTWSGPPSPRETTKIRR